MDRARCLIRTLHWLILVLNQACNADAVFKSPAAEGSGEALVTWSGQGSSCEVGSGFVGSGDERSSKAHIAMP